MADIKISQLGAAIAVGDTDLLPIVSGGNTLKATAAQVKEHSIGNTNISSIGDGSVTGAINALNTDKQPKTLDTPLTIGGVSKTTVEAALDGLVSENQTLTNDLTDISIIGTTNNTGSTITKGTYFYLNSSLVKAKTDIANGATLTANTNYESESGVLNDESFRNYSNSQTGISGLRGVRANRVVEIDFTLSVASQPSSGWYTIGTIISDLMPFETMDFMAGDTDRDSIVYPMRLDASGVLKIWVWNDQTGKTLKPYSTLTYIAKYR